MIKNIIFDWSGVIIDDLITVYNATMISFEGFGAERMSLTEFRKEWEQPYMLFYAKYLPKVTKAEQDTAYRNSHQKAVLEYPFKTYPNIKDSLEKFKKSGISMVILSSNLIEHLFSEIEKFKLNGLFKEVNGGIHDKAEVIRQIIERNKFDVQETIFIGDTTHETKAGKFANIKTASVTWGYQYEDKLRSASPDFIIHNLEELEKVILG